MSLLYMSAAGAVLIIITALIRLFALGRLPKRAFIFAWLVVLVRLMIPFGPVYKVAVPMPEPAPETVYEETLTPAVNTAPIQASYAEESKSSPADGPSRPAASPAPPSRPVMEERAQIAPGTVLTVVWGVGTLTAFSFFAVSYIRGRRRFGKAAFCENGDIAAWKAAHPLRRGYSVKTLEGLDSPMTYGVIKPVILIPAGSESACGLKYALEHEYFHAKRLDALFKYALAITLAVHWFNPAVWLMYILSNRDIELACDEAVLTAMGESSRRDYAGALIDAEERKLAAPPLFSGFGANTTKERITEIMKFKRKSAFGVIAAILIVALLAACSAGAPTTAGSQPEAENTVKNDDSAVKYTNGEYTLSIPEKYNDILVVNMDDRYDNGTLFYVSEKASVEAATADGYDDDVGAGELFGILKVDEASFHEMLCYDMSGAKVFAADSSGNYFIFTHPTDVRFYRQGDLYQSDTEGWDTWGELNEWAWSDVRDGFMAENAGLETCIRGNSMLDMYLARAAYMDGVECTVSTTEYGPIESQCDIARPYAETLMTGNGVAEVTYEAADINETPDGEYVVLNFPEDEERFDFFLAEGKENYVRWVRYDGSENLMKAVFADGTTKAGGVMHEWYNALVGSVSTLPGSYTVDYGESKLYSKEDMDGAIDAIMAEFNTWEGCEMHSFRYGSDDNNNAENVKWLNEHEDGHDFTECIMFYSDFHSPVAGGGAWEADSEYTGWNWWLGRTDGGEWELVDWGY